MWSDTWGLELGVWVLVWRLKLGRGTREGLSDRGRSGPGAGRHVGNLLRGSEGGRAERACQPREIRKCGG